MAKVLVLGGSGLVGGQLVKKLIKADYFTSVTVLNRKQINYNSSKINEIIFNFNDESSLNILYRVDHVFCCLGSTIKKAGSRERFKFVDYELPLRFGRWAEKNKVKSFSIVTSMGSNSASKIFYNKVKGEVEDELKKMQIPIINIFRPSLIMGSRKEFRVGELIGKGVFAILNPVMIGALKKYRGIHAREIAEGMIKHLKTKGSGVFVIDSDKIY